MIEEIEFQFAGARYKAIYNKQEERKGTAVSLLGLYWRVFSNGVFLHSIKIDLNSKDNADLIAVCNEEIKQGL